MSDMSQGPGWWQASDGKWYAPEQATQAQPTGGPGSFGGPAQPAGAPQFGGPAANPAMGGAQLAEWPQRVIAYLIDIGMLIPLIIVQMILSNASMALGLLMNLVVFVAALYFGYLNGATGQSPGKALTGLKVVKESNGQVIGGGLGVIRQFAHFLDSFICLLGWFLPLVDSKKQTIADKVIGTVVLANQPKREFSTEIFQA